MTSNKFNPVDWDKMDPDERAEKEIVVKELMAAREGKVPLALPGPKRENPDNLRDDVFDMTDRTQMDPHADVRKVVLNERRRAKNLLNQAIEARKASSTDTLTGLANRKAFLEALPHAIVRANRAGKNVYLVMMDMDHFKEVNDRYGHDAGDAVLRQIADILKLQCRTSEKPFRWGGEEFAVILDADDDVAASNFCERIKKSIADHEFTLPDGTILQKTISIGFSSLKDYDTDLAKDVRASTGLPPRGDDSGKTVDEEMKSAVVLKLADNALLAAKESGRNRVVRAGDDSYNKHVKLDNKPRTTQDNSTGTEPENQV